MCKEGEVVAHVPRPLVSAFRLGIRVVTSMSGCMLNVITFQVILGVSEHPEKLKQKDSYPE